MMHRSVLAVFAALAAAPLLRAQQTQADAGGYSAQSSMNLPARPIFAGGYSRILQNTDEDSVQVPLGFSFSFYGGTYDQVCIATNGALSFGRCLVTPANEDLTAYAPGVDVPFIAAFWTDLEFIRAGTGAVYYLTDGDEGKRLFVVQWDKAGVCCEAGRTVTFQVILAEATGEILINYIRVMEPDSTLGGLPATIGIRDARGNATGAAVQWSHRANTLHDGMTLRFTRPAHAALPHVAAALNAANGQPGIVSSGWFAIYGTNLARSSREWNGADFNGSRLPLALDGVSVIVNGRPAPICYVSPSQVNVLGPDDDVTGDVTLEVTTAQGSSRFTARRVAFSPAFFVYGGTQIAIAQAPAENYALLGPPELASYIARPARPGETVVLWGTGFGPTDPATPALLLSPPAPLANRVDVSIGGLAAHVDYAGLVAPGLYQFNVKIPDGVSGDVLVTATVGGVAVPGNVTITVRP